jgi:hypothetical protein
MNRQADLYQIVYGDNASTLYTFGVPDEGHETVHARTVYPSLADAKRALHVLVKKFHAFVPVAYGQAYPYENLTFDQELVKTGFAVYGWATHQVDAEDEDTVEKFAIVLMRLHVA